MYVRVLLCAPAVDHGGSRSRTSVDIVPDGPDELDERLGGLRHSMVRPHGVMKLTNQPSEAQLLLLKCTHMGFLN